MILKVFPKLNDSMILITKARIKYNFWTIDKKKVYSKSQIEFKTQFYFQSPHSNENSQKIPNWK